MLRCISCFVVFACLIAAAARAAEDPFVGEWKLNPSKSTLIDVMNVQSVGGNKYVFDLGAGPESVAVNGTDQPAAGGTRLAVTPEGANSWKVVRKKEGRMLLTASWALSKDGKTLSDAFTAIAPDGKRSTTNYVYRRKGGVSGFAGTWESRNNATMNFVCTQSRALRARWPYGHRFHGRTDDEREIRRQGSCGRRCKRTEGI